MSTETRNEVDRCFAQRLALDDAATQARCAAAGLPAIGVPATAIQTVGTKGYDGFAVALVVADPAARP